MLLKRLDDFIQSPADRGSDLDGRRYYPATAPKVNCPSADADGAAKRLRAD
jgi:hypothetical protein